MSRTVHDLFATCPRGLESVLAAELGALGARDAAAVPTGVSFRGSLETAYRACLWSRVASRVLLALAEVPAADAAELYASAGAIPWEDHLAPDGTLAVDFTGTSPALGNTVFGAQRVKDAIVDRFRGRTGRRPSVDLARPDLRVNLHLSRGRARVAVDLSGESLHRRGYREEGVAAPLKENLAAGILLRAGWPALAAAGAPFLDPLCGSGTLPIEAAMIAGDIAPGLLREQFGFSRWRRHDARLWERLRGEAEARRERGGAAIPAILGSDGNTDAARAGRAHVRRAGLAGRVVIERRLLKDVRPPRGVALPGLIAVNPPYGERLGSESELRPLYEELGAVLRERFPGWKAAVLTGNPGLALRLGIRAYRSHELYNGALRCRLFLLDVRPERFLRPPAPGAGRRSGSGERS